MKIVHVIPTLGEGGAERFVVDLCNELSKEKDLTVYLITLFSINEKMFLADSLSSDVRLFSLNKKLGFDFTTFTKLFNLIHKIKPDIVHTHLNSIDYNLFNLLFNRKTHYFHTLHNDALIECRSNFRRKVRRLFYKRNVTPVTISDISAKSFREIYHLNNDCLIYNGRNTLSKSPRFSAVEEEFRSLYRKTNNTKVFLNIANISPIKNQLELVKAFNKFYADSIDVVLLLVGAATTSTRNKLYLDEILKIKSENVFVLGVKDNVEDYLLLSDAFCLSSVMEGMPITIIEAFSTACIPVCTPVGGIPNMINDKVNGILGKGTSYSKLYDMLNEYLLLSESEKIEMKANGKNDFLNKFSIEICAQNHINAYIQKANKDN